MRRNFVLLLHYIVLHIRLLTILLTLDLIKSISKTNQTHMFRCTLICVSMRFSLFA